MTGLSVEIGQFLREFIHSYEQLEILLRLASSSERSATAEGMAASMPIDPVVAADALETLARDKRLIVRCETTAGEPAHYKYQPASPELSAIVAKVDEAYRTRRLEVMNLMSANALERVRNAAVQAFARAFLLRDEWDG
jgi:hypothetical protein